MINNGEIGADVKADNENCCMCQYLLSDPPEATDDRRIQLLNLSP